MGRCPCLHPLPQGARGGNRLRPLPKQRQGSLLPTPQALRKERGVPCLRTTIAGVRTWERSLRFAPPPLEMRVFLPPTVSISVVVFAKVDTHSYPPWAGNVGHLACPSAPRAGKGAEATPCQKPKPGKIPGTGQATAESVASSWLICKGYPRFARRIQRP